MYLKVYGIVEEIYLIKCMLPSPRYIEHEYVPGGNVHNEAISM